MTQTVVVLAAGLGSRLGRPFPKPLTHLANGTSILERQIGLLRQQLGDGARIHIVVGFKMELVMEAAPGCLFVYNEVFDSTNTAKSLLRALRASPDGPVLWLNGDVVFDPSVLDRIAGMVGGETSFVCVFPGVVGAEEVTYLLDAEGYIAGIGKELPGGLGEAIGINYVSAADKESLVAGLERCSDTDYFERGIEYAIGDGARFLAVDIGAGTAVEVDVEDDLRRANDLT
ncbi:MAG: NTP transferase domain-containing protein [Candidatus Nanopelagicales bacterium]|jgi:choline kinase